MQQANTRHRWKLVLGLCSLTVVLATTIPTWRHYYPATVASGWSLEVLHDDIPMVSALALAKNGELYYSQGFTDAQGSIQRFDVNNQSRAVLTGLSKPNGLLHFQGGLVISQEQGEKSVIWTRNGQSTRLFEGFNVEGMATDGKHLYAIEDTTPGRLLRFDPDSDQLSVLREGVEKGEGLSLCADGRLFYSEKSKGVVRQWQADGSDPVVADGLYSPGFLQCTNEGLWITEDATHMARVLLLDPQGQLQVIVKHLRSAQTLIALSANSYLLAEQGRKRILQLNRLDTGT